MSGERLRADDEELALLVAVRRPRLAMSRSPRYNAAVQRTAAPDPELLVAFRRAVRARIERDLAGEQQVAEELRAAVLPVLRGAVAKARARGLLSSAVLFGSFAAGMPESGSDVDLLVEGCTDPLRFAGVISLEIRREVHAVPRESASASLLARVDAEGIAL